MNNLKLAIRTSIYMVVVMLISFIGLWSIVDNRTSDLASDLVSNQMKDAVKTRSAVIDDYVETAEKDLISFAKANIVATLLKNQDSPLAQSQAQTYTEDYAASKGIFEGLYIATTDTLTIAHSNSAAVGIQNREGDRLKSFQEQVLTKKELSNFGILKSPSSGNMVISMYYPVYDGDTCIGLVGAAVYANQLMDSLLAIDVEGLPDSEYVFLNVETQEYIYNADESLLCTATEDKGYLAMLEEIGKSSPSQPQLLEFGEKEGEEDLIAYQYLPNRNWVFSIRNSKSAVYQPVNEMRITTAVVCGVTMIVVIVLLILILSSVGIQLKKITNAIKQIGQMDLAAAANLHSYSHRKDEVGVICRTLEETCASLENYICEVDDSLSAMAQGDYTRPISDDFIGRFLNLRTSMERIQGALRRSFYDIKTVTGELVQGSLRVSDSASQLAGAATQATELVMAIDSNVSEISNQVAESSVAADQARDEAEKAAELVGISQEKMGALSRAMEQISESASAIGAISNNMEEIAKQTNILALNALVEARREGEAGKGFGVVADQIRRLAEQSNLAAKDAFDLIQTTINHIEEGMRLSGETSADLSRVVKQTKTIERSIHQIADNSQSQNEKLLNIRDRLHEISQTVETTAAMAEESAAASNELDGQTNVLKDSVGRYQV